MEPKPERLQKILAAAGLASRRKAEQLIAAGAVSVNGHVITEPGTKADPRFDEIRVDGKLLRGPERHVYLALYKPKGYMTTVSDPEGRPTVMDLLKGVDERVFPVGRLDYMSEGLLLLTNDGDLMAQLTKAGSHVAKTYVVKVSGKPTEEEIDKLRKGIMLPPEPGLTGARGKKQPGVERRSFAVLTQPADIQLAVDQENPWYEVTLTEGRNRQIRRMFEQIGYHIEKIKRVRYGSLTLDLEPSEFRHLTPKEVNQLRKSLETPFKPKPIKAKKNVRAERKPRVEAARFVKGRRGKPSAEAEAAPAAPAFRRESREPARDARPRREGESERPRFNRPRGPEFDREQRGQGGFAGKRRSEERFAGRGAGEFKRPPRREEGFEERPPRKRDNAKADFGFSRYTKPKFSKPGKERDFDRDEPRSFDRRPHREGPPQERSDRRPGGFGRDRKFSKGPGKPTGQGMRGEGEWKPRGEFKSAGRGEYKPSKRSEFKPSGRGDFKQSSGRGDRKPQGAGRPSRPGRFGTPSGERRGPSAFGEKRPFNRKSGPPRPPRRRPDEDQ